MNLLSLLGVEVLVSADESNDLRKHEHYSRTYAKKVSAYSLGKPFAQNEKGIVDSQFWD